MRRRHDDEPANDLRMQRGDRPGDEAAPAVSDDDGVALAQRRDQPRGVRGKRWEVVAARWFVTGAVTTKVRCGDAQPGVGETDELMAPTPPELWEAVQQQDERATAGLGDVEAVATRSHV